MNHRRDLLLGLDAGSVSVKTVVCDLSGRILAHHYRRHNGLPFEVALELVREIFAGFASERFRAVGATGSGGEALAALLGGRFVNEVVAQSAGAAVRTPQARTVIEMGGQDSKLLLFDPDERTGRAVLRDFSMNTLCAAGTGSFLDQQASRLGVSIEEEFGRLALECPSPPHMAGRCSVFAKSDMIHLQQIATPVDHIVAGLCFALARNFCSTIGQGKAFQKPIAFQGGVASNAGMRRAFEAALDLAPGELIVDPLHAVMGALGVAQILLAEQIETPVCRLDALERHVQTPASEPAGLEPLIPPKAWSWQGAGADQWDGSGKSVGSVESDGSDPFGKAAGPHPLPALADSTGPREAFLGIDIGSVSTNVVLIDTEGRLIAKRYLATAGQPIEAVRRGLEDIRREVGDRVVVRGCGTTGSGRYLIGDLVGADVIRNEITAQATAALAIDPTVDTIFEIGGQDSKYIRIRDGAVCDFEMNKACAAGTGSFLEEQAERLGLKIQDEFAEYAFASKLPVSLGDRCTVFMETDLQHHQQTGARKEDLVAGLAYSIVHNYLNRVVGGRPVGQRVFFQGGTAFNRAVVAAFNRVLGRNVVVPPHHEVTGAIGAALLARDAVALGAQLRPTRFKGFDWSHRGWRVETFTCHKCANSCEIRRVQMADDPPLFYGSRCERFEVNRTAAHDSGLPDLFAERSAALRACLESTDFPPPTRGRVGIPMALLFHEFLPLWATFFRSLGFEVVLSGETTKAVIHEGIEQVATEICYPVKVMHGHVAELLRREVDFVFLPSIINVKSPDFGTRDRWNFNCPLVQGVPYTILAAKDIGRHAARIFSPALYLQMPQAHVADSLAEHRQRLRSTRREIRRALERGLEAQEQFRRRMLERGRQVLDSLGPGEKALVIVSRPYNGCDRGINLDVPRKLRQMGVQAIPLDMLPLDEMPLPEEWRRIYWRSGQRIIKAAEWILRRPHLYAIYITNFSCGPDSFLLNFFDNVMGDKPHLQIEIDEHSADAGVVTRCEAFLDTLANQRGDASGKRLSLAHPHQQFTDHRTVYVPYMAPHAHAIAAALRSVGMRAEVMPETTPESEALGFKYTSGKECYPALLTAGDILRQTRRPDFDPARSAFFMGAADGPCRFGQYGNLHRMLLDEQGFQHVALYILNQDDTFTRDLRMAGGRKFEWNAWMGICAADALEQLARQARPYEVQPGSVNAWFHRSVETVCEAIAAGRPVRPVLLQARAEYDRIETVGRGTRPLILVVGEMYVRINRYANDGLFEQIERLGGEVAMPPLGEWVHYSRMTRSRRKRMRRDFAAYLGGTLRGPIQTAIERRICRALGVEPTPPIREVLELARPYVHHTFEGEAILTVGKSVEMIRHNRIAGIVHTMPFTCMPGTIATALLQRVQEDHGGIPVLTLAFTGQKDLANRIRLEAFLHQACAYHESRR